MQGIETAFEGTVARNPTLALERGASTLTMPVKVSERGWRNLRDSWVRVTVTGEQADQLARELVQGDRVYIEGRAWVESWKVADGARFGMAVAAFQIIKIAKIGRRAEEGRGLPEGNAYTEPAGLTEDVMPADPAEGEQPARKVEWPETKADPVPFAPEWRG